MQNYLHQTVLKYEYFNGKNSRIKDSRFPPKYDGSPTTQKDRAGAEIVVT